MNTFSFAGKTSREFGLYITGEPYSGPVKEVDVFQIPGRRGDLPRSSGGYRNIDIHYSAYTRNRLAVRSRAIKAWLYAPSGYQVIENSYDRDYFRYGYYSGPLDIAQTLQTFGQADIVFTCRPMQYSHMGNQLHRFSQQGDIINPEAFYSEPYIRVYGSGPGRLYFNSASVEFTNIQEYIELDSEIDQVYKGTQLLNSAAIGELPVFMPGKTLIQWEGGITHLEIRPRWCTL